MTPGRMGFLIVFDANRDNSLQEAQHVCRKLLEDDTVIENHYVYLVANKMDKDPTRTSEAVKQARDFAESEGVRFAEVSALEFTRVRKVFREIIEEISMKTSLYMTEEEEKRSERLAQNKKKETAGSGGGA